MTNDEGRVSKLFRHSDFVIPWSLDIRHLSFGSEVKRKPIACECRDSLQSTRFLEKMRRAGNNLQLYFAVHLIVRLLV